MAGPSAPSYIDSSTRGKIHLRWWSSPPHFAPSNVLYHVESYVNVHSLGPAPSSFQIILNSFKYHNYIVIMNLSCFFITRFTFIVRILWQQTAQDTLISIPCSPSERCVCSRQISVDLQLPLVRSRGRLHKRQAKSFKIQDFAHGKDIGRCARLDQEKASEEHVQAKKNGDKDASHSDHEWECEKPSGRSQGCRMRTGIHYHSAPNPICGPCGSLRETGKDWDQVEAHFL